MMMNAQQRAQARVSRRRRRIQARTPAGFKTAPSWRKITRYVEAAEGPKTRRPDDYRPRPGRKAKKYR